MIYYKASITLVGLSCVQVGRYKDIYWIKLMQLKSVVHFLRYLNSLYYDDYPAALENLHCYFDYSFGRYEIALLCLGMMHLHFGHPKQALEVVGARSAALRDHI
ncbi:hypothetical protein LguiB_001617 [Lonicera macranthoides]